MNEPYDKAELRFIEALRRLLDLLESRDGGQIKAVSDKDAEWGFARSALYQTSEAFKATELGKSAQNALNPISGNTWFGRGSIRHDHLRKLLDKHAPLDPVGTEVIALTGDIVSATNLLPSAVRDAIVARDKKIASCEGAVADLQREVDHLRGQRNSEEKANTYLREQLDKKSRAITSLTRANTQLRRDLIAKAEASQRSAATLEARDQEIDKLNNVIAVKNGRIDKLVKGAEYTEAHNRNRELMKEINWLKENNLRNSAAAEETLEAVVNRKNDQIAALEKKIARREQDISGLTGQVTELQDKVTNLESRNAYNLETIRIYADKATERNETIARQKDQIAEWERKAFSLTTDLGNVRQQHVALRYEHNKLQKEKWGNNGTFKGNETINFKVELEMGDVEKKMHRLAEQLSAFESSVDALDAQARKSYDEGYKKAIHDVNWAILTAESSVVKDRGEELSGWFKSHWKFYRFFS